MIGVDVGGTFTDVVAIIDGKIKVTKVPSVPNNPHESVIEGARRLGVADATIFNHASTKGLNAIITRNLPKIGFLTTDGHRDMLDAGRAWRPFDGQLNAGWRRSFGDAMQPLVPRYLRRGVIERILASGEILIPLDQDNLRQHLKLFKHCNIEGLAVCLINAYVSPTHEKIIKAMAKEVLGSIPISISTETSPRSKEYSRASTTVIDVMMKLVYGDYANNLDQGLKNLGFKGQLNFADCTASLMPFKEALKSPYQVILAGPAAGAASCVRLGEAIQEESLICCDVGGTSTDVALIMNGVPFTNDSIELEHDLLINALSTEVSSVGAGGGSIVSITASGDIQVGPESAGASPGPACYSRGGTYPTVTDACLLIGIIEPKDFAEGQLNLDIEKARNAFLSLDTPLPLAQRIAFAYRIAVNNIAEEVTNIAIRHGASPRDFSLVAYGAAGPMLLPEALDLLQVKKIIIPPYPGLFSALGLLATDLVYSESCSAYKILAPEVADDINMIFSNMETAIKARVNDSSQYEIIRSFDGRILGQSWETPFIEMPKGTINASAIANMAERFHAEYLRRNGQGFPEMPVQAVGYRVQLIIKSNKFEYKKNVVTESTITIAKPIGSRSLRYLTDQPINADLYQRDDLMSGTRITGPAIIQEPLSTTLIGPDQEAYIGSFTEIYITAKKNKGDKNE